jgi:hypothetical protein
LSWAAEPSHSPRRSPFFRVFPNAVPLYFSSHLQERITKVWSGRSSTGCAEIIFVSLLSASSHTSMRISVFCDFARLRRCCGSSTGRMSMSTSLVACLSPLNSFLSFFNFSLKFYSMQRALHILHKMTMTSSIRLPR